MLIFNKEITTKTAKYQILHLISRKSVTSDLHFKIYNNSLVYIPMHKHFVIVAAILAVVFVKNANITRRTLLYYYYSAGKQ